METIKKRIRTRKAISEQKKIQKQIQNPKVIRAAVEGAIKKQRELAGLK
jgi:hypothetical protein